MRINVPIGEAAQTRVRDDVSYRNNPMILVGLGEVLFDFFESGTATLGGAPLNVAVHMHQLASALAVGQGVVVSRVGNDLPGEDILRSLAARHMATQYLQLDHEHATGRVSVS